MNPRGLTWQRFLCVWLAFCGASLAPQLARANTASTAAGQISVHDVRVGETVELSWPGLPRDAREVEVLLSVDGGARFSLRASAEVDAARGSVRWRVPALPTLHARLRLRWGDGRSETLLPPTPEFRITGPSGAGPATAPTWDEDDPASSGPLGHATADLASNGPTLGAGDDALPGLRGPDGPDCALPTARGVAQPFAQGTRSRSTAAPALATCSRSTPRRE